MDSPEDIVFDLVQAAPDQPVGRPISAEGNSVSVFKRAHLGAYLQTHYRGPNMVLAAAAPVTFAVQAERRLRSASFAR